MQPTKPSGISMAVRGLKTLGLAGVLAPIVYLVALIVGNVLDPSYSQVGKTVSELIQQGAPNRDLLNGLFVLYNLLLIPFGVGLFIGFKKGWARTVVVASIIAIALLGVFWTLLFPLDANGKSESFTGMMHLVVGGLVVPLTFALEIAFWRGAGKDSRWGRYGTFSLIMFIITLITGPLTVAFVNSDFRGLFERLSIGATLFWIELIAVKLYLLRSEAPKNN